MFNELLQDTPFCIVDGYIDSARVTASTSFKDCNLSLDGIHVTLRLYDSTLRQRKQSIYGQKQSINTSTSSLDGSSGWLEVDGTGEMDSWIETSGELHDAGGGVILTEYDIVGAEASINSSSLGGTSSSVGGQQPHLRRQSNARNGSDQADDLGSNAGFETLRGKIDEIIREGW